jgi:hypothetical protein
MGPMIVYGLPHVFPPLECDKKFDYLKMNAQDIISKVVAVSHLTSKAICILSALGAVKEAFLLQPSGVVLNHKV